MESSGDAPDNRLAATSYIAESIEFLKRFHGNGDVQLSVYDCRTFFGRLVENFLTNFTGVSASVKKNGESSECFLPFKFCRQFVRDRPEVFVRPAVGHLTTTPTLQELRGGDNSQEDQLTEAFLLWFVGHVVALLGRRSCELLHEQAGDTIQQLLIAVKWRDIYFFSSILQELIYSLADLVKISEKLYEGESDSEDLKRFVVSMENVHNSIQEPGKRSEACDVMLSPANFCFGDTDVCDLLQLNLTWIVCQFTSELSYLCTSSIVHVLWGCLCWQLENGDIHLKTASLDTVAGLLQHRDPLPLDVEDYLLECLLALLGLLLSGCEDFNTSDVVKLETALANVWRAAVVQQVVVPFWSDYPTQLRHLLLTLSPMLTSGALSKLHTDVLRNATAHVICEIQEVLPVPILLGLECNQARNQLMAALLSEIGSSSNLQYLVTPVVKGVLCELSACEGRPDKPRDVPRDVPCDVSCDVPHDVPHDAPHDAPDRDDTPTSGWKPSQPQAKRKRKHEDGAAGSRGTTDMPSHTYHALISRLSTVLDDDLQAEVAVKGEGVKVIVEIVCSCVAAANATSKDTAHRLREEWRWLSAWLPVGEWRRICGHTMHLVEKLASAQPDVHVLNSAITALLHTFGTLLSVQDCADFDSEFYQTVAWVSSLPWLLNDLSWQDLRPTKARDIAKIAARLTEHIDMKTTCGCLSVLSLLPKDVASKWRVHVFRQALSESNVDVTKAALEAFPMLLYHLGPNANHLVYDLIHPCMEDLSVGCQRAMAGIVGPLACVVSRKAILNRSFAISCTEPMYRTVTIGCTACDSSSYPTVGGSPRERPRLVDPNMFSPFLQLVTVAEPATKLVLVGSMKRMFGHIGVRRNNAATINVLNSALGLIEDGDYNVRIAFSKIMSQLLGDSASREGADGASDLILARLREAFRLAEMGGCTRRQETVLLTIAQLGRVSEGEIFVTAIIFLLESMFSSIPLITTIAPEQLKYISESQGIKTEELFVMCSSHVCKFLVAAMHDAQTGRMKKTPENIITEVAKVFQFPDIKTFLTGTEKFIVPYLVSKGTPAASALIKMIATQLNVPSRSKLLITNTKYVYSYIVRFSKKEADLQNAIHFLQKETDFELMNLVRFNFQSVHNELLLHLSTHPSKVFDGLKVLSTYCPVYKGPPITTNEEMANYLQSRLLGVLAHFDSQLLVASVPMDDKRLALESLISIIRMMGSKIISGIRHKVMSTLRIGLQFTDHTFVELSCRAWNCFIRSLELAFLGQMLPQIVATLLPLLKQLPKQVADIFNYMIVENRKVLKEHFRDIDFLPEIAELTEANAIIKHCTEQPASQPDFKIRLVHSMNGIQHESLDVKLHALSKLKKQLTEEREAFFQLVVGSETADPVVSQLLTVLLKGCREPDPRAQQLYAECLGKCSAIDPGRLELSTNNPKAEMAKFHASIDDDNFFVALINEIVKSYLAATKTDVQDCSSFALQSLLKLYGVLEPSDEGPGARLWRRFPEHVQEILVPFFTSRYMLTKSPDWSNLLKPIYCSKKGSTFKEWVFTWTAYLTSKVKQEKPFNVFNSCIVAIKYEVQIALYILPHVVLHVLLDGSAEDIQDICNEINEVLNRPETKQKAGSNFQHMSTQTIFNILDYLTKWKRFRAQMKAAETKQTKGKASYLSDPGYVIVNDFLARIPEDKLAHVSYSCQAFSRALMHFEQFIGSSEQSLQKQLDFIQRLYVAMDEPDGVLGVAAIRQTPPTLQEQILTHGRLGQQHEMQACYEQAIQTEPDEVGHHEGLLRSLMDLGQQSKALHHATGVISQRKAWAPVLNEYQIEAAWKLGNWDKLEMYSKADKGGRRSWPVLLGRILLSAKDQKEDVFLEQLQLARQEQMGPLSAASMEIGSYQRGHEHIVRLHMLSELEESVQVFLGVGADVGASRVTAANLLSHWRTRLNMMQASFRIQEPVLSLRRILLMLAQQHGEDGLDRNIGQCWLSSTKIAREAGYLQTAYSSLLQASEYNMPQFCLQKAQWLWEKGDHDQALALLEREMQVQFGDDAHLKLDTTAEGQARRLVYAQVLLQYGRYCEETSSMESNAIVKQYREVVEVYPDWEDGHFYLAKYFDKIMTTLIEDKDFASRQGEFVTHVVRNFGQSLQYGNQFIYQSMPRMLSLWLDFGTSVVEQERKERSRPSTALSQGLQKQRLTLNKLNSMISGFGKNLAPYQLFFAFPQLISRICHAQPDVFDQLKAIIARLVVTFPQQALWLLMAVSKSSYQMRVKRCQDIFATAREMKPSLQKVIQDYVKLTERLLELCEKDCPSASATLSVTQHFRSLKRLFDDSNFSAILLPLQSSMTVTLPHTADPTTGHNPFPGNLVFIRGFEDTIEVLPSLQKPKKITMMGSDGRLYIMMCKPKDDLRKDCRLMEFNGIVNKFLRKDPESRRRSLNIRTYTVIPLNEECGLLEWVNNTSGLRHILMKLYREKGLYTSGNELKALQPPLQSSLETKLQVFKHKLLPKHPPIFSEWFLRTFPDPTAWYNARLAYCRTIAVMSMVGYILGLGDRHGENILFDSTSGDCVHVDFNCLFNRGETFEWPEKVPFRLTHNLVNAMGPLKLEGIFRRACEVTLRVIRNEIDPLMSVLKPFVYDPLVEWSKPARGQRQNPTDTGEITNEQARVHVQNIEHRLKGILKNKTKPRGLALSVEGHVNYLIQEAADDRNLCQMYIGWAAYL